jgi:hypothetical protein
MGIISKIEQVLDDDIINPVENFARSLYNYGDKAVIEVEDIGKEIYTGGKSVINYGENVVKETGELLLNTEKILVKAENSLGDIIAYTPLILGGLIVFYFLYKK